MKKLTLLSLAALTLWASPLCTRAADDKAATAPSDAQAKSDADTENRAKEWVASLGLNDAAKEARVTAVITTHLKAIRDWHNSHPGTDVPEVDPATGKKRNALERQYVADSAMPKSVHEDLMNGLRKDLTPEQVATILDKYTIGKVAFTLKGYHSIVPDLTQKEETTIRGFLEQAREEAVDYKNMKEIVIVFEKYKTKSEQYLNSNGRDWHALYKAYTKSIQDKKKAAAEAQSKDAAK